MDQASIVSIMPRNCVHLAFYALESGNRKDYVIRINFDRCSQTRTKSKIKYFPASPTL